MRDTKLDGLEPYVRALWGWNREAQARKARDEFDPANRWIVVCDGADAGYIHLERNADAVTLAGIYLVPPMRGRGLGAAVLQRVLDDAGPTGSRSCSACSSPIPRADCTSASASGSSASPPSDTSCAGGPEALRYRSR